MAKIAEIAAYSASISDKTVWTFVRVRDSEDRSGWGEASLQGEAAAVHAHVERMRPALAGLAVPSSPDTAVALGGFGRNAAEVAALCAVDQALWDLVAQMRGQALRDALGTSCRSTVGLYANINRGTTDRSPDGFAARAREAVAAGSNAVKVAPFDDVRPETAEGAEGRRLIAAGIERVAAVRAAIGSERRLLVDCHWRLTEPAARNALRALEPLGLYWFECPLAETPSNFPALRRLRAQANGAGVRLAGCEEMTGLEAFGAFLDAGVYDVIMPDVKYAGGLAEMLRIGEAAARRGVLCSPHNPSGPIAHAHSVHLSSLLAAFPFLEFQYGESPLFFDLVDGALPDPRTGECALPTESGLGTAVRMERLRALLVDFRPQRQGSAMP